jgi:integrase
MTDTTGLETKPEKKTKKHTARRGSGSIFRQPGTNRWTLQFYKGGKRIRKAAGTDDYKAAQQKLTQFLSSVDKGEPIPINKKFLVSELYAGVERDYRLHGRKTLRDLQGRWTNHLKEFFGDMLAVNVTKETVEIYRDQRIKEGAKRASVNREVAVIKKAFYLAEEKLPRLPVFPTQLKENNARTGFIEDTQFTKLTEAVGVDELWLRCFLEISYCWGWRVSEVIKLRVKQVDLKQRLVRLEPGTTKSGAGREAPMNDRIYQLLKVCSAGKGPNDYVLTRANGGRIRDFRRRWENLLDQAELPGLLIHDFRRSAARNLRRSGCPESVVMELCGWRTAEVFRRYAIVSSADKRSAMEKLDAQRALDEAKRKEDEKAQEADSHNFSLNSAQSAPTGSESETSSKKEYVI